jgi:hypothetical protein
MGKRITLRGISDCTVKCTKIRVRKLKGPLKKGGVAQIVQLCAATAQHIQTDTPDSIEEIVSKHNNLFQEPKQLPLARQCDHSIPLIPGVSPVNIKPYR